MVTMRQPVAKGLTHTPNSLSDNQFRSLGVSGAEFSGLETFEKPLSVEQVTFTTDEVTALCPVTGQPDQYTVDVSYLPQRRCLESKSIKLYLQQFRNVGIFCEAFAERIALDLQEVLLAHAVHVRVTQKPRGGISIAALAVAGDPSAGQHEACCKEGE